MAPSHMNQYCPLDRHYADLRENNGGRPMGLIEFYEQHRRSRRSSRSSTSEHINLFPPLAMMLNTPKLSELLSKNVDQNLFPRMFIMTPNATLLAYSIPTDVKDLKDMAALVSMMWKEREAALHGGSKRSESPASIASSEVSVGSLETLTIESGSNNFLARAIQPQLLFVLVGGVPPGRQKELKVTSEVNGDLRYPSSEPSEDSKSQPGSLSRGSPSRRSTSNFSTLSQREKDMKLGLLHIQRKKLDTMVRFIKGEFNAMGFVMPSDQ